jgi:hypothetical protein
VHRGAWAPRYWSSPGCLFHHAYPPGFRASKPQFGRTFVMSISAGPSGPVFQARARPARARRVSGRRLCCDRLACGALGRRACDRLCARMTGAGSAGACETGHLAARRTPAVVRAKRAGSPPGGSSMGTQLGECRTRLLAARVACSPRRAARRSGHGRGERARVQRPLPHPPVDAGLPGAAHRAAHLGRASRPVAPPRARCRPPSRAISAVQSLPAPAHRSHRCGKRKTVETQRRACAAGPLFFGFSDPVTQRAIAALYSADELAAALQARAPRRRSPPAALRPAPLCCSGARGRLHCPVPLEPRG